ncbi:MAG: hypothetical protein RIR62_1715 [Pseudomonadota bacterium]|jgi:hypothetical protein
MSDDTPLLSLPLILPSQAQKHVTHNEALRLLDVMVQLAVTDRTRTTPPAAPAEGDRHLIAAGATGAWAGRAGQIAAFWGGAWLYLLPRDGWMLRVVAEGLTLAYAGGLWAPATTAPEQSATWGVNATADNTNRLSVAAPATLLSHEGAGHQLKINKAADTDTASLLFQTAFSGRAEIGTMGEDALGFKVSANGSAFVTALRADGATGRIEMPQGATVTGSLTGTAVTQSRADGTAGRLLKNFDHGIGARATTEVQRLANLDDPDQRSGFFATDATTTGTFPAVAAIGCGIVTRSDANGFTQLFFEAAADTVWSRRFVAGTGFAPWRRLYAPQNILGPVSQAAGVPTGAVIERGSTATGAFVRFADGTLICTHSLTASATANTVWTFPAPFVGNPAPSILPVGTTALSGMAAALSATSLSLNVYNTSNARQAVTVWLKAVGRWV